MKTQKVEKKDLRLDAFVNLFKKFNTLGDPLLHTNFVDEEPVTYEKANAMYRFDWLTKNIVNLYPDDSLREGINVQLEDQTLLPLLTKRMNNLNIKEEFRKGARLARLYGGTITIIGVLDQDPETPLDVEKIDSIAFLNTFDRWQLQVRELYTNPLEPNYGKPKIYTITPRGGVGTKEVENLNVKGIHESRVIRWDGDFLPEQEFIKNSHWHESILATVRNAIKEFSVGTHSGAILFQDFISKTLKMENLLDLLEAKDYNAIESRMQYLSMSLSSNGLNILSPGEEFNKVQTPITGFTDLLKIYMEIVASAAKIPMARLFGQQLGTLSGADETTRSYFDNVRSYQDDVFKKPYEKIIDLIFREKNGITKGIVPEKFTIGFNTLWQETDETKIKNRNLQAQTDQIYIANGVIAPEEVAINRFSENGYSYDTNIDLKDREAFNQPDKQGKEGEVE